MAIFRFLNLFVNKRGLYSSMILKYLKNNWNTKFFQKNLQWANNKNDFAMNEQELNRLVRKLIIKINADGAFYATCWTSIQGVFQTSEPIVYLNTIRPWLTRIRTRAVATIGAWGGNCPPPTNIYCPPHQTFGKLKFTIENFNSLIFIN